MKTFKQLLEAKHPDSVKKVWSTGKHAYATTKAGETYKLNHSKLNGKLPQVGDLLIKSHHTLNESVETKSKKDDTPTSLADTSKQVYKPLKKTVKTVIKDGKRIYEDEDLLERNETHESYRKWLSSKGKKHSQDNFDTYRNLHGLSDEHAAKIKKGLDEDASIDDFTLEEIQEFVESEEYEQLDEISKQTLGSYIKKASGKLSDYSYGHGFYDRDRGDSGTNHHSEKKSLDLLRKSQKRERGISKAVKKLVGEETEQLDELSKQTLGSYIKKASDSKVSGGIGIVTKTGKSQDTAADKYLKRNRGISKAVGKLTKESEDIDDEDDHQDSRNVYCPKCGKNHGKSKEYGSENLRSCSTCGYKAKKLAKEEVEHLDEETISKLQKHASNPYSVGASVGVHKSDEGHTTFKYASAAHRAEGKKKLVAAGFKAKHMTQSTADKAYAYRHELTVHHSGLNESMEHDHIQQTLADKDINSKVENGKIVVHKDNVIRAKNHVKKLGHKTEVVSGLNEGTHYHSVWYKGKNDSSWSHHFDADNKEDAHEEARSIRNNGEKAKIIRVHKDSADWRKPEHREAAIKKLNEEDLDEACMAKKAKLKEIINKRIKVQEK